MRLTRAARRQLPVLFDYELPREVKPDTSTLLPFRDYYRVIVMLSGKDSIFALMTMLERGVEPEQIEIWHQNTDGRPVHLGGAVVARAKPSVAPPPHPPPSRLEYSYGLPPFPETNSGRAASSPATATIPRADKNRPALDHHLATHTASPEAAAMIAARTRAHN